MRAMKRVALVVLFSAAVACGGPSGEGQGVKTPDEILAEQEAQAAEDEKNRAARGDDYDSNVEQTEDEKLRQWDERQADLELKRAARSAETCPESVTEKAPKGTATVNLVFSNDGNVKSSEIAAPYADTPVGDCVLRAMGNVIVPAYEGPEKSISWEIDLSKEPAKAPAKKK